MKYLPLIWTALWRKPVRTSLTVLSICAAFVLFGVLAGVDASFKQMAGTGRLDVLVTNNPAGLQLPLADLSRIVGVPGVRAVDYNSQLLGYYQLRRNLLVALPVDPGRFFFVNRPQFTLAPAELQAFIRTRTAAVITPGLQRRYHWHIGDQVPFIALQGRKKDGTSNWFVDIVGTFDVPGNPLSDESVLLMHYDYFDAARADAEGTVQRFTERITDPAQADTIGAAIDRLFGNSPVPTHTQTERSGNQATLAGLGDLDFLVDTIVGAAFFTLLFVTASTMNQSYRERTRDFAVMKTLGFTDLAIAALLQVETLLLCGSAAIFGLLLARGALPWMATATSGLIPVVRLPFATLLEGIAAALGVAFCAALPATVSTMHRPITASLNIPR